MTATDRISGIVTGVAIKAPCRAATTANITLSDLQTIDGVSLASGDRVLVHNQSDATENGIYTVDSGNWTRAVDFDGTGDFVQGTIVVVVSGTILGQTVWEVTTTSPVIGNALVFTELVGLSLASTSTYSVATLAILTALADRPSLVSVAGATAANDGGGGMFYWSAGDVTAADGVLVINPSSGVAGRYKRVYAGSLKAEWFGYRADNSTDNTAALAAGITAASALNGELLVPPGRGKIAGTLTLAAAMVLRGVGWQTILVPTSDAIGTMVNMTGTSSEIRDLMIDASAIVAPTFTAININSAGFQKLDNLHIYGAGVGIAVPACNAGRMTNMRIQNCPVCVQTGGVNGSFPGDITWDEIVCIPTTAGTGWIVDGNSNAQYMHRIEIIGGATCLNIRGAGGSTIIPDGIIQSDCNYTASSGPVVQILKGRNIQFNNTVVGGSTAGDGILINAATASDIDGILIDGSQIRANFQRGINWQKGANLQVIGGQVHGSSDGGGSGVYSNLYVGSAAVGLLQLTGVMMGLSSTGNLFGNITGPAKYAVEIAAGALTDVTNFPGRILITGCVLSGNTTGTILDASSVIASRKKIFGNFTEGAIDPAMPQVMLAGVLLSADMNVITDQAIAITLPAGCTQYRVASIFVSKPSTSLTTAVGGIYTAAAKAGLKVVDSAQVYSGLTAAGPNTAASLISLATANAYLDVTTLYFALTTAQGAPATADIRVFIYPFYS